MTVRVLHLSDIHVGPDELSDIDRKVALPGAGVDSILERLSKYVRSVPIADYVVVTGDVTIRGSRPGMEKFAKWLQTESDAKVLPSSNRIIVVPGNHDVAWPPYSADPEYKARYRDFFEVFGRAVPHAHIPEYDPPLDAESPPITAGGAPLWGGVRTELRFGSVHVPESHPFILDLEREVLFFAFNSTLGCGVHLPAKEAIVAAVSTISQKKGTAAIAETLRSEYLKTLRLDAGMIGADQLRYFDGLMTRLRREIGGKFDRLSRIALLHHHVSHLWNQQVELKEFDSVVDAAQLKQILVEHGFQFVLHGHKHTNHVGIDASVIPVRHDSEFRALCVVSGGTVGGHPRLSDRQSFKLLTLDRSKRGRLTAMIDEIPLLAGSAGVTVQNERRRIRVPLLGSALSLRDFPELKRQVDLFVARTCAPEIYDEKTKLSTSFMAPFIDRELVDSEFRYDFFTVTEPTPVSVRFYDVMLAPEKIGFRHRARILWMLMSVKAFAQRRGLACRAILMIGDLESTRYNASLADGEIEESLEKLATWFRPAIRNGYFEIRRCTVSQADVDTLSFDL